MTTQDPAAKSAAMESSELTEEEAAGVFDGEDPATDDDGEHDLPGLEEKDPAAVPDWAFALPAGLKVPVGAPVTHLRVRAGLTAVKAKGDRVLVVWPLNELEERQAYTKGKGDPHAVGTELAKATIRAVDGAVVDRTGKPGIASVAQVWRDLGPKGRMLVRTYYQQMHSLGDEEKLDFLANCMSTVVATTA